MVRKFWYLACIVPNFIIGCSRRFGCSSRRTNFYNNCPQIKYCNPFWCHFCNLAWTGCGAGNTFSALGTKRIIFLQFYLSNSCILSFYNIIWKISIETYVCWTIRNKRTYNIPCFEIIEPLKKLYAGWFAASGRTNNGYFLTLCQCKI